MKAILIDRQTYFKLFPYTLIKATIVHRIFVHKPTIRCLSAFFLIEYTNKPHRVSRFHKVEITHQKFLIGKLR